MPLAPGTRLGPYEILKPLGAGGMGEVYRAHDPRLRRDVAVKVLQESLKGPAWERFQREARSASALNHPNICAVYDVGDSEGRPYLVMELLEGQTLREYAGKVPMEPAAVIGIAVQIADALEAAHSRGVIHRDVKPDNIIVLSRGHVKVLDFGLAKQVHPVSADETRTSESLTETGTLVGTPHYMPPEVLQGRPADARSDVWALGVVLYQLLSGKLPFQGPTTYEVCSAILREPAPPLPAHVPHDLRSIVERCMSKRPEDRFQNAGEVRQEFDALRSETRHGSAPARRHLWKWSSGAAAVLAIAAILWLWPRQAEESGRRTSTGAPASVNDEANLAFELAEKFYRDGTIARAEQSYRDALALDPAFTEARSRLGFTYALQIIRGESNDAALLYKAEEELRQAAKENADLPTVHSGFAALYFLTGRHEAIPAEVDPALRRTPLGTDLLMWRAQYYVYREQNSTAKDLMRSMLSRDQLYQPARIILGDVLRREGDLEGAIREEQRVLEQAPGNTSNVRFLALAFLDAGRLEEVRRLLEEKRTSMGTNYLWRHAWALLLAAEGKREEAIRAMDDDLLKFGAIHIMSTLETAEFYALLGDSGKAIEWLDRAVRNGDDRINWFRRNPRLVSIRSDPRVQRMMDLIEARRKGK